MRHASNLVASGLLTTFQTAPLCVVDISVAWAFWRKSLASIRQFVGTSPSKCRFGFVRRIADTASRIGRWILGNGGEAALGQQGSLTASGRDYDRSTQRHCNPPHPGDASRDVSAEVGDAGYGEDPTLNRLEALAAEMLGKEDAAFMSSGCQGNLVALLAHCSRGQEGIVGDRS
ncbi:beta-eliminating lyase-related protein, partial [Mesorhizobium sp. VK9D]|uniref:beta-eliminating lyase-related protein n=1 Tax=Mesorhizobium australafricanum TaxID=3072311 RepID=UPI002A23D316